VVIRLTCVVKVSGCDVPLRFSSVSPSEYCEQLLPVQAIFTKLYNQVSGDGYYYELKGAAHEICCRSSIPWSVPETSVLCIQSWLTDPNTSDGIACHEIKFCRDLRDQAGGTALRGSLKAAHSTNSGSNGGRYYSDGVECPQQVSVKLDQLFLE
jgi:hypothetical protein